MGLLTTNGMFILDEIHTTNGTYNDVIGGGGMYAMLGACIVSPNKDVTRQLRWIVDKGSDFPAEVAEEIEGWGSGVVFRSDNTRLTTRGWNLYGANDLRQFKYMSKKKQIEVKDWLEEFGSKEVSDISCFHLLCSDQRVASILDALSNEKGSENRVFVWEPIPDLCDAEHASNIFALMHRKETIVISPNAEEGARLFGVSEPSTLQACEELLWKFDEFMDAKNMCVLRCGKLGSLALSARDSHKKRQIIHMPAYHFNNPAKVVDPTGGGNSFLGGFSLGYVLSHGNLKVASVSGNIAAGCAIEQLGVPKFRDNKWNGMSYAERLSHYITEFKLPFTTEEILGTQN